ncbi:inositol monophosphatase family protein [Cohnella herbarum]|uniref:inositol-phosphate phosphatase n=1 Tax=Cohnella herbarum TaxID=2728023 RepID=A0A7Z2ZPB3_9BACL|nr:inositol monophosphatase family protein [Cohnella herbarum]QJD87276.1 Cof-type HAD-IIB family hydrolase [Cohnella herbarum]
MNKRTLLITDLDGTLLTRDQRISPENEAAIKLFQRRGGLFTFATGRTEAAVDRFVRQLQLDIPMILYNGARITDPRTGEVLYEEKLSLPLNLWEELLVAARSGVALLLYRDGNVYAPERNARLEKHERKDGVTCKPFQAGFVQEPFNKILLIADRTDSLLDLERKIRDCGIDCEMVYSESDYLEILPSNVSKGTALGQLLRLLEFDDVYTVAVGDNLNDLTMLMRADLGVAVENAHPDLKQVAKSIGGHHERHAISLIVNELLKPTNKTGVIEMNWLEEAKRIAMEAGTMIKSRVGSGFLAEEKSSSFDVVTEVDRASEKLIRDRIREIAPDHTFLGEEESFDNAQSFSERLDSAETEPNLWIVDPIDGTSNFVQGISGFTVSIAMASYGEIILGVVYDPMKDEMFYAEKGKGAFMNGIPLRVALTSRLDQSVVGTGFPSKTEAREKVMAGLLEVGKRCRTIRALGSAACQMSYVAAGRLTAFWENGLNVWDVAAGVVLIREAGGQVSDTRGAPFSLKTKDMFGSNGNIHAKMLACLK